MAIEIRFTTRTTARGCAVTMTTPVRKKTKRFRSGYACSELSAKRWIMEQIEGYRDYENECKKEGREIQDRLFFINGVLTH